jgi:hypothetical protein
MFAMGVVKGQLDQMNKAAEAAQVKELMDRTLLQMYKDVFSLVV